VLTNLKNVGNIFLLTVYLSKATSIFNSINKMALNERERRVLTLDKEGKTTSDIAHKLQLHRSAISRYRKTALKKLQQATKDVEWAKAKGIIPK